MRDWAISLRVRRLIAVVLTLLLTSAVTATAQSASADTSDVQLSGSVTLFDGAPAEGILIQAFWQGTAPGWSVDSDYPEATATTGADGSYTLSAPSTSLYLVVALPPTGSGLGPAYESAVPGRSNASDLDFVMTPGASVSGKVVSQSAAPLEGASVYLREVNTGEFFGWSAKTDASGAYDFNSLPAGDYRVTVYADGFDTTEQTFSLAASQTLADFTITAPPHASLSGRVTSSTDSTQGIEGIVVTRNGESTTTAADGTYTLAEDQYETYDVLAFSDPEQRYLPQWWNGASSRVNANGIHLSAGQQATGYDAALVPAATVSGRVTAFGDGAGIPNVAVTVFVPNSGSAATTVFTDSAGNYSARGLVAGTYSVGFDPAGSQFARKTVANVVVLRGKSVTIDAILDRTSGIVGKVTFEGTGSVDPTSVRLRMTGQTVRPDAQGNFAFTGLAGGSYKFEVIPDDRVTYVSRWYENGSGPESATPVVVRANDQPVTVDVFVPLQTYPKTTRVSGADRYAVALAVSRKAFPGTAPTVYIATGENYPDALSAGAAAVVQGGPLLMTPKNSLPADVKQEIQRLKPSKIVVVGGPNSVSPAVLSALKTLQSNTIRVDGEDRFAVSRQLAVDVFGTSGADVIYIATGRNFPDALGASGTAGYQGGPVLLVDGQASDLDSKTKSVLATLHPDSIVIAGGPASVSPGIAQALSAFGSVERLGGADRYEASAAINLSAYTSSSEAFLVTGSNFPDALSGSAWAGHLGAPLYVSRPDCVPEVILDALHSQGVKKLTLIGGPNSLSSDVLALTPCG